jgi:predicted ATPase
LFLDDIQWANESSIDMLRHLALDHQINHTLLLVCACRSDAVAFDDPLSHMLRQVEDRVPITELQLVNYIRPAAMQDMVCDLLRNSSMPRNDENDDGDEEDEDDCADLTNLLYQQTNGNVFFATQLLRLWSELGFLQQNHETGTWSWCEKDLLGACQGKQVHQVLETRLKQLPRSMLEHLQAAACVGNEMSMDLLIHENGVAPDGSPPSSSSSSSSSSFTPLLNMTRQDLDLAQRLGLMVVNSKAGVIRFAHDDIHQAVYQLIPESQRAATHWTIGRDMWNLLQQHQPPEALEKHIFLVSNQLIRGCDLVKKNQHERNCLAALLYQAGQKAIGLSAFLAAATYFSVGIGLLSPQHWNDNYEWSLELYNSAAEVEYCIGHLDRVDELLREIFQHTRHLDDQLRSYNLRIHALGARNDLGNAIAEGFHVLVSLGERFPSVAGTSQLAMEFARTMWMLRGKTNNDILNLSPMDHKSGLEAIRFLTLTLAYVRWKKPEFVPLVAMRIIRLTLRHGLTGMSK